MENSDRSHWNLRSKERISTSSSLFFLCVEILIWIVSCFFIKARYMTLDCFLEVGKRLPQIHKSVRQDCKKGMIFVWFALVYKILLMIVLQRYFDFTCNKKLKEEYLLRKEFLQTLPEMNYWNILKCATFQTLKYIRFGLQETLVRFQVQSVSTCKELRQRGIFSGSKNTPSYSKSFILWFCFL